MSFFWQLEWDWSGWKWKNFKENLLKTSLSMVVCKVLSQAIYPSAIYMVLHGANSILGTKVVNSDYFISFSHFEVIT